MNRIKSKIIFAFCAWLFCIHAFGDVKTENDSFRKFALALSGIIMERNYACHDALEPYPDGWESPYRWRAAQEDKVEECREILKDGWLIENKKELVAAIEDLKLGPYSLLFKKFHDSFKPEKNDQTVTRAKLYNPLNISYNPDQMPVSYDDSLENFMERFDRYYDPKKLLFAWDWGRIVMLARYGYQAGYIKEKEAWNYLLNAAQDIIKLFTSWEEYGANYILGRMFWMATSGGYMQKQKDSVEVYYRLMCPGKGAWSQTPWNNGKVTQVLIKSWIDEKSPYSFIEECRSHAQFFQLLLNEELESIKYLIDKYDVEDDTDWIGYTPVFIAAGGKKSDTLAFLIKKGFSIERDTDLDSTPLCNAIRYGCLESFKMLIDAGADINKKIYWGKTPLIYALSNDKPDCVRILIAQDVDCNDSDDDGWTPLMYATRYCSVDITELLIEKGAALDEQDNDRWTALMYASSERKEEIAKLLIEKGADPDLKNKSGQTALDLARKQENPQIVKLLVNAKIDRTADTEKMVTGDIRFTTAFKDKDLKLLSIKGQRKEDSVQLTCMVESGMVRSLYCFDPPKGEKLSIRVVNAIPKGTSALSFSIKNADISRVLNITGNFYGDTGNNFFYLNFEDILSLATINFSDDTIATIQVEKEKEKRNPDDAVVRYDHRDIRFSTNFIKKDLKLSTVKGERNGDSIIVTLAIESEVVRSYLCFDPPNGERLKIRGDNAIQKGTTTVSFSIKIADIKQVDAITISIYDDVGNNFVILDFDDILSLL